jgi:hypothetical protein
MLRYLALIHRRKEDILAYAGVAVGDFYYYPSLLDIFRKELY